ncbi:hypothetical protein SAMN06265365_101173 [Tistlia consotensis]|uniref:Spermidine synthase n=1 Tax=Tistlia consotensis USBA 355 TaxID=560819 RepID=A0A1Y6B4M1_9PROT|nr:fused MFS/spermidine synthase [Tistlia consotensis]SME89071.1 hypothetical protein SAMN05428998_101173 [Tistlia consotensis USBA 355]SNR25645.1 hypothetical protein SAMN06265365_101173 [Tistlia consotensis]
MRTRETPGRERRTTLDGIDRPSASGGRGWRRAAYAGALATTSAGGLVLEIVAGRMIAPYVGMSLYTWTAVIAVVLAGFSLGHWWGGRLSDGGARRCALRLAWLLLAAAATTAACLPLIRLASPWLLGGIADPVTALVLLALVLFLLPSLFIGTVSPILTRLAVDALPEAPGRAIGQMYAVGAAGSIAGTLLAGYLFLSWIGTIGTVLSVAGCYLLLALAFAAAARPARREAAAALALALLAGLGIGAAGRPLAAFTAPCLEESDYYCIRVVDLTGEIGRPAALMVLDHLGHGINDRDDPARLHSSYLRLTDRLLRARLGGRLDGPGAFSAFFVGGGAYTLPRAWAASHPRARLTVAELDPAVTRVAERALWLRPAPGLAIEHGDARRILQGLPAQTRFDIVVGDAFHDISVPQHLTTREFAGLLRRRLAPHGFYVLNAVDSARRPLFVYAVVRTLGAVFETVEVWADAEQLSGGGRITFLVVAGREPSPAERYRGAPDADDPEGTLWLRWPAEDLARRTAAPDVPLLTDDYAPVDRLMLPVLAEDK